MRLIALPAWQQTVRPGLRRCNCPSKTSLAPPTPLPTPPTSSTTRSRSRAISAASRTASSSATGSSRRCCRPSASTHPPAQTTCNRSERKLSLIDRSFIHSLIHELIGWLIEWMIDWSLDFLITWLIDGHKIIYLFIDRFRVSWSIDDKSIDNRRIDWLMDWSID